MSVTWFEEFEGGLSAVNSRSDTSLAELHQEIARKLDVAPRRIAFLPIGEWSPPLILRSRAAASRRMDRG
jgi:hypothetical protein